MTVLHELLAVKPSKEAEGDMLVNQHMKSFSGSHHLFKKTKKVFVKATEEEGESPEPIVEEETELVTTVAKELKFVFNKFGEVIDLLYTIDKGNVVAQADIEVDGEVIAKAVPATFLVHLEKRLNQLQRLINAIPTADPAAGFKPDTDMGKNVLKANVIKRPRTAKHEEFVVIVPPTEHHPAQTAKQTRDIVTGQVETHQWSGMPTTEQKADLLERVAKLKAAVIAARARANKQGIEQQKIFGDIENYLLRPLS